MATAKGFVEKIVYRNEENGYTVLTLADGDDEMTLTGSFPPLSEGEYLEAEGEETYHPIYGPQMKVEHFHFSAPADADSVERYLASGVVKGVGTALAKRIVKKFGDDTFRIMEEEPERLAEIKGISERKAMEIAIQISEKREVRQAIIFLQQYGISLNLAAKIYNRFGSQIYTVIRKNPYRLADEISGIGFRLADEIASKVGIFTDSDYRIKCGIQYALLQAVSQGHTCVPVDQLLRESEEILQIPAEEVEKHLGDLQMDKKIIVKNMRGENYVYSSNLYYLELNTAKMMLNLNIRDSISEEEIERKLARIERENRMVLDENQRKAVMAAVNSGVLIITGGPGTGKTTTINTIIRYFEQEDLELLLAAPTGRAAKRMKEATGSEAKTIHRMLEVSGGMEEGSRGIFGRNEDNPLEADVVIIDEMSMVDIHLMHALLRAVTVGTRLILVGDENQLPSVGPGNVLKDLIRSEAFPVVMLTKIFRQASESDIIVNAHKIHAGEKVQPDPKSKDFLFVRRDNPGNIVGASITLVRDKLPGYVQANPFDIQVLVPMRKGNLGVEQMNVMLQEHLNPADPSKKEKEHAGGIFREGDKVMQIKNNYQLEWEVVNKYGIPVEAGVGVFNGDQGFILSINHFAEEMTVVFDEDHRVIYPFKQLEELELAYAVTIHKSQGSEYAAVVMPLLSGPRMLMNRNLLYTAVTRAKSCVTIVGSVETFQSMIENTIEQKRHSGLKERVLEILHLLRDKQDFDWT